MIIYNSIFVIFYSLRNSFLENIKLITERKKYLSDARNEFNIFFLTLLHANDDFEGERKIRWY